MEPLDQAILCHWVPEILNLIKYTSENRPSPRVVLYQEEGYRKINNTKNQNLEPGTQQTKTRKTFKKYELRAIRRRTQDNGNGQS